MKVFPRAWVALISLSIVVALLGCQVAPTDTSNAPASATTPQPAAQQPTPVQPPAPSAANAGNIPVTLPVLDAFFADESFAGEVKTRLQLTDEQVTRLRAVAHEETARLRESDQADEQHVTTTTATTRATEKIKDVIGAEKTEQLLALVRERWASGGAPGETATNAPTPSLPEQPNTVPTDTRIVVNAPAYRMDVYKAGQLLKTYKIGIGYPEFPLPTGVRSARTIIFNPTWTPPDEPWVEAGKSKVQIGQKVEAGSPLNPLGPIKIPIGLPSLIHGGKSPAKLGGFASHGCVGLTSPQVQDFARMLAELAGTQLTAEEIAAYAKQKTETKSMQLAQGVPVELRYETIMVEDGKLHIYRDVYDHGTNTEETLRRVLDVYGVSLDELSAQERAQVMDALAQMAHDAMGKPAAGAGTANDNTNAHKDAKNENAASAHVTRTIKGQKEIVIELAALKGKGYPAPVNYDTGTGAPTQRPQPAKTGKHR
ncbi:MAG: L,D-transpeptidase family protein [Pyrinomonadaceae bacterium]